MQSHYTCARRYFRICKLTASGSNQYLTAKNYFSSPIMEIYKVKKLVLINIIALPSNLHNSIKEGSEKMCSSYRNLELWKFDQYDICERVISTPLLCEW